MKKHQTDDDQWNICSTKYRASLATYLVPGSKLSIRSHLRQLTYKSYDTQIYEKSTVRFSVLARLSAPSVPSVPLPGLKLSIRSHLCQLTYKSYDTQILRSITKNETLFQTYQSPQTIQQRGQQFWLTFKIYQLNKKFKTSSQIFLLKIINLRQKHHFFFFSKCST